ncbi:MAG: ROK family protein [Terriglobia bacterium]|jgi:glucokinase
MGEFVMVKPESAVQRVFQEITSYETVSVSRLARQLGIQPQSLLGKLRSLVTKGLLVLSEGRAKVGINPGFGQVVGIDLGASHLHFALADFRGEILQESNKRIRPEDGPRKLIGQVVEGARSLAAKAGGRLRGVAIGVPSPVDAERGVVAFANNLPGWKNIHLARELEEKLRVPIFLENDANMAAIGEHWRGVAQDVDNFVFIAIGTGTGAGVFVSGKLYRGRTGSAGEVYRMNIDWPRWAEDFGDSGHFESSVSGMGIAAEGRKALQPPASSGASDLATERDAYFVFEAFRQGDPNARSVLERVFTMLGVGISNVVAILDPDLIVLGGGIVKGVPEFMLSTVGKVVQHVQKENTPPIKLSALEDKAQTFGAVRSALAVAQQCVARRL